MNGPDGQPLDDYEPTMPEFAEAWWRDEQGRKVPKRNTPEWDKMFWLWIETCWGF